MQLVWLLDASALGTACKDSKRRHIVYQVLDGGPRAKSNSKNEEPEEDERADQKRRTPAADKPAEPNQGA